MSADAIAHALYMVGQANEDAQLADGFEAALIGYVERFGQSPVALYDRAGCIKILMERDSVTREDAEEFFEFNVIGAYVGEGTPAFATLAKEL